MPRGQEIWRFFFLSRSKQGGGFLFGEKLEKEGEAHGIRVMGWWPGYGTGGRDMGLVAGILHGLGRLILLPVSSLLLTVDAQLKNFGLIGFSMDYL